MNGKDAERLLRDCQKAIIFLHRLAEKEYGLFQIEKSPLHPAIEILRKERNFLEQVTQLHR